MSNPSVKDDIRSRAQARMEELEPLVAEYQEMERIVAAIDEAAAGARPVPRRALRPAGAGARGNSARAAEAEQLIRAEPGIAVSVLAERMGIGTTYLYRLLPKLERQGVLRKEGRGYHPA